MSTEEEWPSDAFGPFSTNRFGKPVTTVEANEVIPCDQCAASVTPSSPETSSAYG